MPRLGRGQPLNQAIIVRSKTRFPEAFDVAGDANTAEKATSAKFRYTVETFRGVSATASGATGLFTVQQEQVLSEIVTHVEPVRGIAYTILLYDIVTQQQKEEVLVEPFQYSLILNSPGTFQGKVPMDHPKATRENLDPGTTAVYVVREGIIV